MVSLRTELLLNFAVLVAVALLLAVTSVLLFVGALDTPIGALWLSALIAADVFIFVLFGAHRIRRIILRPLRDAVEATEAIAAGDLGRRVPPGDTAEFAALASSVNRMTDRLLQEQHHLIRAEKLASIGRLAAGVAHEIGNPLGAVNGYAHILRSHLDRDQAALDALDALERESARIDRIVRGLLDYARQRRTTPTTIDVNDTIRSVVRLLESQGTLKRTQLRLDLAEPPPSIAGQRHDLEQLFVNLLLNAVHAMQENGGGGTLSIVTHSATVAELESGSTRRASDAPDVSFPREPSARVRGWIASVGGTARVGRIIVADSGPGVSPEEAERIFDPFYTTKEPGQGTGLGLAIVARIVDNLRGVIWVQRAREGGAAFVLLFPLATPTPPSTNVTPEMTSLTPGPTSPHMPSPPTNRGISPPGDRDR